ncbi:MAG: hypothetical protein HW421_189 [Ignavibacteria bacterium]|nr:hypothetical protein [Ignavibacteria bacterium]
MKRQNTYNMKTALNKGFHRRNSDSLINEFCFCDLSFIRNSKIILLIFSSFLLIQFTSCKTTQQQVLPPNNVSAINTKSDNFAPARRPIAGSQLNPCAENIVTDSLNQQLNVNPSKEFIKKLFGHEQAKFADAITFLSDNSGFLSISYSTISEASSSITNKVGGTDIFEFSELNGKYSLSCHEPPINTKTWDSHPFAVADGKGNILLIWSSDREDNLGGYSLPFVNFISLDNKVNPTKGNSDLYFAFRIGGKWREVWNFSSISTDINSTFNDETPFLYCICHTSIIYFASNRNGSTPTDFDIFSLKIHIDFDKQQITALSHPESLPKGNNEINSKSKEFYPIVLKSNNTQDSAKSYLYFSSDRYKEPVRINQDTIMQCVGGFDIYRYPIDVDCRNPIITYNIVLKNAENPSEKVKSPVIEIRRQDGSIFQRTEEISESFKLNYGEKYSASGGSHWNQIECEGSDRTISHYMGRRILNLEPQINERKVEIEYDSIVRSKRIVEYDTTYPINKFKLSAFSGASSDTLPILNINYANDSIFVKYLQITERVRIEDPLHKTFKRKIPVYDTIPQYDTTFYKTFDTLAQSKLSLLGNFPSLLPLQDTTIFDTINIYPKYYYFPPCHWDFITHLDEYRRNVPYFQTGFWEVNTSSNLKQHLQQITSKLFHDATFIELHPENQYFGVSTKSKGDTLKKEAQKNRRNNRIAEYIQYAKDVDKNLNIMREEIAEKILPTYNELITRIPTSNSKLIIQIEGYSDLRPILRGHYIGQQVKYVSGDYDSITRRIATKLITIKPNESLVGKDNEDLSLLRAYYGYLEILKKLEENELFRQFEESGEVLMPHKVLDPHEFEKAFEKSKIIFLVVGKGVDVEGTVKIKDSGKDYYSLDPVRRINIIISRIEYVNGTMLDAPCCKPK